MMSINIFFTYTLLPILLGSIVTPLWAENPPIKPPVKIDVEMSRSLYFLKILIYCKNEGKKSEIIKLKMLVYKKGVNKNISQIAQIKDIHLQPGESSLPFITEMNVKPEDTYEVLLQVFGEHGDLLEEKTFKSGSL